MCYGMGCEWENSYGECTAPRSVSKCPHEEEDKIEEEELGADPEKIEREGTQWWEEKLKNKDFLWLLGRGKNGDDN